MDLPCPEWIKHAEHKWSLLNLERRENLCTQLDIDEIFDFGLSETTSEDLHALRTASKIFDVDKCAQTAKRLREKGNSKFKERNYTAATLLYSKGVCHSPGDSEELALCYANRSAALFQLSCHQECLEDIGRALAYGYPPQLQPKLLRRKEQCEDLLGRKSPGHITRQPGHHTCQHGQVAATSRHIAKGVHSKPGITSTCMHTVAPGLEMLFSPERGRYLVVKEGACAGKLLLEDQAFSCVLIPGEGSRVGQEEKSQTEVSGERETFGNEDRCCHRCLVPMLCPVPCISCSYARYCSERCQQQAWLEHHRWECLLGAELRAAGVLAQLAFRVALIGGIHQVKRARTSGSTTRVLTKQEVSERIMTDKDTRKDKETVNADKIPCPANGQTLSEQLDETATSAPNLSSHGDAYQYVYSLLPHVEGHSPSLRFLYTITVATLYQMLQQRGPLPLSWGGETSGCVSQSAIENSISGGWGPEASLLGATALRHLFQLRANAQAIIKERLSDDHERTVQACQEVRVATAVFPILSLVNHACCPNTSMAFNIGCGRPDPDGTLHQVLYPDPGSINTGVCVTVRSSRDLFAGEEILHCYGPHYKRMAVLERQRLLMEQYFFTCQCKACVQESQSPPEGSVVPTHYKCPKCSGPLQVQAGRYVCASKGCPGEVSSREMDRTVQLMSVVVDQALELLDTGRPAEALSVLQQAAGRAERHLLGTHPVQGELADAMARTYASMGEWASAATYLRRSVECVSCQYGADSQELGQQLFKLAQLLFNGRQTSECMCVITQARHILSVHGLVHNDQLQELQAMEDCLNGML